MRSPKELQLNAKIIEIVEALNLSGKALRAARAILEDEEVQTLQEYANTVSIVRLHYNDHGPVHMRTVAYNTIIMMGLLRDAGIKTSLEIEECGDFEDSLTALILASILHDIGMSVSRQEHEVHSEILALPYLDRFLAIAYRNDLRKRVMLKSLATECIFGHMGNRIIHSLEAGVILVADGCDMTKGRARIPMALSGGAVRVGDIHKISANSIEDVSILAGTEKPILIEVHMSSQVGLFQIEEVLLGKIAASTVKNHVELYVQVNQDEKRRYL
ncbi:MAG: phosphohydrolase [Treponema sp.]|jgi:metal-dependent HD superfamily phosphatase/phosphodiesterase|nr:phosphohydrolase [Treponema sp.]